MERAQILLLAAAGVRDLDIAQRVHTTPKTVRKWRRRYPVRRQQQPEGSVDQWLADDPRVGRPDTFDEKLWVDLLALATSKPEDSGRPITHWTAGELADELVLRGRVPSIHPSTISRFLARCALQPHRTEQWMNRKADPEFEVRATDVKACLVAAAEDPKRVVVSFDEKTGMQAKERIAPDQPARPGQPARLEFEYERHGTLVLFAFLQIHSGKIRGVTATERTNPVTAQVMTEHFEQLFREGYERIDVVLDQLNTHWSEDLVRSVAELCSLPDPPHDEIASGSQRRAWLARTDKPIAFHYTPKHASWLDPVEIWFAVLVRKVLRRGSFSSTRDLEERVHRFISYYNDKLAHPYRFKLWKKAA